MPKKRGEHVKLKNCTKADLLWVIKQAEKLSLGDIHYWIDRALDDLEHKKELDRIERAKELAETAFQASQEYVKILKPYEGKKIIDIPMDVLEKADFALKRSREANKKWAQLIGIKTL